MSSLTSRSTDRLNNFDLVRLFAALSVVASHLAQHGIITHQPTAYVISAVWQALPGVPIFFIVSGFLITGSWQNRQAWMPYLWARALRIFPALFVSTCVTTALLWAFGYTALVRWEQLISWFLGTVSTLYLYHTPKPLWGFADGMPNASVWTLPVEMQFYMLLPLVLILWAANWRRGVLLLVGLFLLSGLWVVFDAFKLYELVKHPDPRHTVFQYFWWFGLGVLARLHWPRVRPWVAGNLWPWLGLHGLSAALLLGFLPPSPLMSLILATSLAGTVLAAAYTAPALAERCLRGTDLSYGVYLFHRPFIHAVTGLGFTGWIGFGLVGLLTWGAAAFSWRFIEKPCLRLKLSAPSSAVSKRRFGRSSPQYRRYKYP